MPARSHNHRDGRRDTRVKGRWAVGTDDVNKETSDRKHGGGGKGKRGKKGERKA